MLSVNLLFLLIPAVSIISNSWSFILMNVDTESLVVPAISLTIDRFEFDNVFKIVLLPTLGFPNKVNLNVSFKSLVSFGIFLIISSSRSPKCFP